jgi:hypothetical protein
MRDLLFWNVTQRRLVVTDVSGQHFGPIFRDQVVQEECIIAENVVGNEWFSENVTVFFFDCLTLEYMTDRLS